MTNGANSKEDEKTEELHQVPELVLSRYAENQTSIPDFQQIRNPPAFSIEIPIDALTQEAPGYMAARLIELRLYRTVSEPMSLLWALKSEWKIHSPLFRKKWAQKFKPRGVMLYGLLELCRTVWEFCNEQSIQTTYQSGSEWFVYIIHELVQCETGLILNEPDRQRGNSKEKAQRRQQHLKDVKSALKNKNASLIERHHSEREAYYDLLEKAVRFSYNNNKVEKSLKEFLSKYSAYIRYADGHKDAYPGISPIYTNFFRDGELRRQTGRGSGSTSVLQETVKELEEFIQRVVVLQTVD